MKIGQRDGKWTVWVSACVVNLNLTACILCCLQKYIIIFFFSSVGIRVAFIAAAFITMIDYGWPCSMFACVFIDIDITWCEDPCTRSWWSDEVCQQNKQQFANLGRWVILGALVRRYWVSPAAAIGGRKAFSCIFTVNQGLFWFSVSLSFTVIH